MGHAHYFLTQDPPAFLRGLEARHYRRNRAQEREGWIVYSKLISGALTKHYSYSAQTQPDIPSLFRVTYDVVRQGAPLRRLTGRLKALNRRYQASLRGWKTKRPATQRIRHRRFVALQRFLQRHGELIGAFKYPSDDRLTEGNYSFNLQVASTPKEQAICIDFLKALVEAFAPEGIVRGHRTADKPLQQRNGWIKRFAVMHKKLGWSASEITRHAQKELREGSWNQRLKLQYNLSPQTISKLAGLKLPRHIHAN